MIHPFKLFLQIQAKVYNKLYLVDEKLVYKILQTISP